ncbi:MAG: hypothetical protein RL648_1614 [Verrucomicrobiota bacterium]|jgi:glycosyltransferase involved in cell wall biosynthesis
MKLAWFTPLPPAQTEIGNVSARLLPQLSEAFDLTVFTETTDYDRTLRRYAPIIPFSCDHLDWKQVHRAGHPVYHIGNNYHFHCEIIRTALLNPGIVVLHDLSINETLLNIALHRGGGQTEYFSILQRYGGEEAVTLAKDVIDKDPSHKHTLVTRFPLFEHVARHATGIISHNPANIETIRAGSVAPIQYAPLPLLPKCELAPPIDRSSRQPPYSILLFGFLGSDNRRLIPFLEALSESGVKESFRVIVAGKYDKELIKNAAKSLGLKDRLVLRGFVSDDELDKLLEAADLVPNLRWPSRGESSATQLRIWNFSLPSLVTQTAYYATLPENAVAFVRPENEKADIIAHLRAFAADPLPWFRKGLAGRCLLAQSHSSEGFIQNLKTFLPVAEAFAGKVFPLLWSRNIAQRHLASYPAPLARSALLKRCASEVSSWISPDSTGA